MRSGADTMGMSSRFMPWCRSSGEDRVDAAGEGDDVALSSTLPAGAALLSEMLTHAQ